MKLLYDLVYSYPSQPKQTDQNNFTSTGATRVVLTRGGPLDVGFYHTDPNRSKMTIEMYVCFDSKYGFKAGRTDNTCLMMRTLGRGTEDRKGPKCDSTSSSSLLEFLGSPGIVWSLCVGCDGSLQFIMGGRLSGKTGEVASTLTVKSGPGVIGGSGSDSGGGEGGEGSDNRIDEDIYRSTSVWYHVVAVIDSSSGMDTDTPHTHTSSPTQYPSAAAVTLYVNSDKVGHGSVVIPFLGETDLSHTGALYVGPCLPWGSRLTELRVVRTCIRASYCMHIVSK